MLFGEFPRNPVVAAVGELDRSRSAVRMGWLYALHLRSALGRGRWWQALWMLQSVRDVVVGLYCQRLDLPQAEGRGVDRLPADLLDGLVRTHPSRVELEPLSACFEVVARLLLDEAERHGVQVSADLAGVLGELTRREQDPVS